MARVLLSKGDRIVEADLAQQLDDGYRVEEIAADHVVLVYLPLGFRDSLPYRSLLDAEVAPSVAKPLGSQASAEEAKEVHAAKPADVHWEGPAQVRAGAMFDVTLHVNSEQPLSAAPLEVRYERDVLQPVNIRPGNVFASGTFNYRINPDGLIQVGASGKATAPSVDADVVVLTFKPVKSAAAAEVKLSSLALEGVEGKRVPHAGLVNFRTRVE